MRSSSNPPDPQATSPAFDAAAAWVVAIGIGLVPLLWLPWFQSGFEVPRRVLVLAIVGQLTLLSRGGNDCLGYTVVATVSGTGEPRT